MVRRDPETGQFVSGNDNVTWSKTEQVTGAVSYTINAADLSGGTSVFNANGDETEIVDFGPLLANDEVFMIDAMMVTGSFGFPTTATAESSGVFSYAIAPQSGANAESQHTSPFYKGNSDTSEGVIDINHGSRDGESALFVGNLYGEASAADTTNGLGVGSDYENEREVVSFHSDWGATPVYDQDDALYSPMEFHVDNISDHAINATVKTLLQGRVEELD